MVPEACDSAARVESQTPAAISPDRVDGCPGPRLPRTPAATAAGASAKRRRRRRRRQRGHRRSPPTTEASVAATAPRRNRRQRRRSSSWRIVAADVLASRPLPPRAVPSPGGQPSDGGKASDHGGAAFRKPRPGTDPLGFRSPPDPPRRRRRKPTARSRAWRAAHPVRREPADVMVDVQVSADGLAAASEAAGMPRSALAAIPTSVERAVTGSGGGRCTDGRRGLVADFVTLLDESVNDVLARRNDWVIKCNLAFGDADDDECVALLATLDGVVDGLEDALDDARNGPMQGKALSMRRDPSSAHVYERAMRCDDGGEPLRDGYDHSAAAEEDWQGEADRVPAREASGRPRHHRRRSRRCRGTGRRATYAEHSGDDVSLASDGMGGLASLQEALAAVDADWDARASSPQVVLQSESEDVPRRNRRWDEPGREEDSLRGTTETPPVDAEALVRAYEGTDTTDWAAFAATDNDASEVAEKTPSTATEAAGMIDDDAWEDALIVADAVPPPPTTKVTVASFAEDGDDDAWEDMTDDDASEDGIAGLAELRGELAAAGDEQAVSATLAEEDETDSRAGLRSEQRRKHVATLVALLDESADDLVARRNDWARLCGPLLEDDGDKGFLALAAKLDRVIDGLEDLLDAARILAG